MKESRKIKKSSGAAVLNLKELVGKMMFCMTLIMLTVMVVMAGVRECFAGDREEGTKSEIAYGEYPKAGYTSYGSGYVKAKGNYEYLAGKEKAAFWWEMPDSYSIYDFDLVFQGTQKVKAGCETYDVWGLTKNKLEGVLNAHGGGRTTSIAVNNETKKLSTKWRTQKKEAGRLYFFAANKALHRIHDIIRLYQGLQAFLICSK